MIYKQKLLRSFACFAVAVAFGSCAKSDTKADADVKAIVPVLSTRIILGSVTDEISVTGKTDAQRREKLVSPIAGKITGLDIVEGSYVKAGQTVAVILTKEAQASVNGARLLVETAKDASQRATAEQTLKEAELTQNGVKVQSQISGLVTSKVANLGEVVGENQELATIIDPSSIVFVADVPLAQMQYVRIGTHAIIAMPLLPNSTFDAVVTGVKPDVDPQSQTSKVVFTFTHLSGPVSSVMKMAIAGTARIIKASRSNVMLVPKDAVTRNDETNTYSVSSFGSDSIAHDFDVVVGGTRDSLIEIRSEQLKPGMNIITVGNYALPDSTRITRMRPDQEPQVKSGDGDAD